jgi:hypothetical protein
MIVKLIFNKEVVMSGFICLRVSTKGKLLWHRNKPLGSIKGVELLDHVSESRALVHGVG